MKKKYSSSIKSDNGKISKISKISEKKSEKKSEKELEI